MICNYCQQIEKENLRRLTFLQCEEFAINATYRDRFDNHSEVQVNWFSKDFPDIAHIHATLYYFKNGTSSEVGRYKLQKTKPEGYTIQVRGIECYGEI